LAFVEEEEAVECIELEIQAQGFLAVDDENYSFDAARCAVLVDSELSTLFAGSSGVVGTS
jgi:hypothetical protein